MVYPEEPSSSEGEGHGVYTERPEANMDASAAEDSAESEESVVVETDQSVQADVSGEDSDDETSDNDHAEGEETLPYEEEEEMLPERRSARIPKPRKTFTYRTIGGDPTLEEVDPGIT